MNINLNNNILDIINSDEINNLLISYISNYPDAHLYIVGGYLRDLLLRVSTVDRDYVISGYPALTFAKDFADHVKGNYIQLDSENKIARVVLPGKKDYIDIAECVGSNIKEDLSRRDFTLNAMAYPLNHTKETSIIDNFRGIEDLDKRIIRTISEKNILDDPLRILRAYRIAAQINGTIHDETLNYIANHYSLLNNIAIERIQSELTKFFSNKNSFVYLKQLTDTGILELLIPELEGLRKVPGRGYHHLGLFEHTLEVFRQIEILFTEAQQRTKDHLLSYASPSTKRISALKYSALLHDIAKPKTWLINEDGKHTFLGHPADGAIMSEVICKRLKLPNTIIKIISKLVKYHLYPSQLSGKGQNPSKKAKQRLFRRLGNELPEAILLAIADRKSALGKLISKDEVSRQVIMLNEILEEYYKFIDIEEALPRLLNGKEVMDLINLKPSKKVGQILSKLRILQLDNKIVDKEEAINWVLNNYRVPEP